MSEWNHTLETFRNWESWSLHLGDGRPLRVIREYKNTKWPPSFGVHNVEDSYFVDFDNEIIAKYPLSTPLEEVLALAIAEARLR